MKRMMWWLNALLAGVLLADLRAESMDFAFAIPRAEGAVSLGIFDREGKLVRTLATNKPVSEFTIGLNGLIVSWDGKDDAGKAVTKGLYEAKGIFLGNVEVEEVSNPADEWADVQEGIREILSVALLPENRLGVLVETAGQNVFLSVPFGGGEVVKCPIRPVQSPTLMRPGQSSNWSPVSQQDPGGRPLGGSTALSSSLVSEPPEFFQARYFLEANANQTVVARADVWTELWQISEEQENPFVRLPLQSRVLALSGSSVAVSDSDRLHVYSDWEDMSQFVEFSGSSGVILGAAPVGDKWAVATLKGLELLGGDSNPHIIVESPGVDFGQLQPGGETSVWAVVNAGDGIGWFLGEFSLEGEFLRKLRVEEGWMLQVFDYAAEPQRLVLLEQQGETQRVRVLELQGRNEAADGDSVVSDWAVIFSKSRGGALREVPDFAELSDQLSLSGVTSPLTLRQERLNLRLQARGGASWLETSSGLKMIQLPVHEVSFLGMREAGTAIECFFQMNDRPVRLFVRGMNTVVPIEAGTIEVE